MKVKFLGTAAAEGIPALFCRCETCQRARRSGGKDLRMRASVLIGDELLADLGPDINAQRMAFGLDLSRLETVVFTHSHSDHLDGFELTRRCTSNYCHIPQEKPLRVYGNQRVLELARQSLKIEFGAPEDPSLDLRLLRAGQSVQAGKITVTALAARHDPAEECLCYLFADETAAFLLANDTDLPGEDFYSQLKDALAGRALTAASLDCTFGPGGPGGRHMDLPHMKQVRARLLADGCADGRTRFIATHFTHNCGCLHSELEALLMPEGFEPAWDGMTLEL